MICCEIWVRVSAAMVESIVAVHLGLSMQGGPPNQTPTDDILVDKEIISWGATPLQIPMVAAVLIQNLKIPR